MNAWVVSLHKGPTSNHPSQSMVHPYFIHAVLKGTNSLSMCETSALCEVSHTLGAWKLGLLLPQAFGLDEMQHYIRKSTAWERFCFNNFILLDCKSPWPPLWNRRNALIWENYRDEGHYHLHYQQGGEMLWLLMDESLLGRYESNLQQKKLVACRTIHFPLQFDGELFKLDKWPVDTITSSGVSPQHTAIPWLGMFRTRIVHSLCTDFHNACMSIPWARVFHVNIHLLPPDILFLPHRELREKRKGKSLNSENITRKKERRANLGRKMGWLVDCGRERGLKISSKNTAEERLNFTQSHLS